MHKPKAMTRICLLLKFQHISRGRLTLVLCGCSWRACCSCSCRCSCRRSMISSNESNIETLLATDTDRSPGTCTVALPTADWVAQVRYTDQWTGPSFGSTDEQWTRKKDVLIQLVVIPSARGVGYFFFIKFPSWLRSKRFCLVKFLTCLFAVVKSRDKFISFHRNNKWRLNVKTSAVRDQSGATKWRPLYLSIFFSYEKPVLLHVSYLPVSSGHQVTVFALFFRCICPLNRRQWMPTLAPRVFHSMNSHQWSRSACKSNFSLWLPVGCKYVPIHQFSQSRVRPQITSQFQHQLLWRKERPRAIIKALHWRKWIVKEFNNNFCFETPGRRRKSKQQPDDDHHWNRRCTHPPDVGLRKFGNLAGGRNEEKAIADTHCTSPLYERLWTNEPEDATWSVCNSTVEPLCSVR